MNKEDHVKQEKLNTNQIVNFCSEGYLRLNLTRSPENLHIQTCQQHLDLKECCDAVQHATSHPALCC